MLFEQKLRNLLKASPFVALRAIFPREPSSEIKTWTKAESHQLWYELIVAAEIAVETKKKQRRKMLKEREKNTVFVPLKKMINPPVTISDNLVPIS